MSLDSNFKSICETIKQQDKQDPKLIEAVDYLLGMVLICSPVVLGPTAIALLPTLAVKNELIKIAKAVFDKVTNKRDDDYLQRHETMRTAYGLIVFTSFLDALDERLPEPVRQQLRALNTKDSPFLKEATGKTTTKNPDLPACEPEDSPLASYPIAFPHPTEFLSEQCERQSKLWKEMAQNFVNLIKRLAFWGEADEKTRAAILAGLDKIELAAARRFEAQYFELARKFEDFAIWANLQSHKETKALIATLSEYVKSHAKLISASASTIDIGFAQLHKTVLSIPEVLRMSQAEEIASSLSKHYQARINDPIIEDKEASDQSKPRLSFPKVIDAFVPQSFRVLRQTGRRRLEDESNWSGLPRRNDLGPFLLSYLSSPYSTEAPLLILGHPGSGKSLLTTILSAQLMSKQFTAIRVPLREVNADADIATQIEDAIRRITGVAFESWIKLSSLFLNCPPLVILDGYDELLQASGQVFASYVKDAQRFQERELEQGRPLRIIITSRVTLIDKATIPHGSTIVKLLEFDERQREYWCDIWNKSNVGYFRDAGVDKFSLPSEGEKGAEKILNLAEQPLLLLMLALYDSEANQLKTSRGLDRTKLYDSLLRRFIMRERGKDKEFTDSKKKEVERALSTEMQRLGVAALGMYNRRKVHILSPELNDDLCFFKLERRIAAKQGRALSQADLLLGSFFFVHKSKAQHTSGAEDSHEETAAFEFLHNTFGEFLTADFILRRAVSQVSALRAAESNDALRTMIDKIMGTADGFEVDWFASLIYTPLFTRPVVMEMIREWAPHVLGDNALSEVSFVQSLDKIVLNQVKRMLTKREMPQIMRGETAQEGYRAPFGDHPLVGHIAIYSINLVLLRLVAGTGVYVFDESEIATFEDGTRPWDRLVHMWRSWFSNANLNGLTSVMLAERKGSKVTVSARSKFQDLKAKNKFHEFHNLLLSLGDSGSAAAMGLHIFNPCRASAEDLNVIEEQLDSEGLDLGPALSLARLLILAENLPTAPEDFVACGKLALEHILESSRWDQLEHLCLIIAGVFEEELYVRSWSYFRDDVFREIFYPRVAAELAVRDPKSACAIVSLARRMRDVGWLEEFSRRFSDEVGHHFSREGLQAGTAAWTGWIRLLREIGYFSGASQFKHRGILRNEFLDRIFDHRQFVEISQRSPETGLAYIRTLIALGGGTDLARFVLREMGQPFFDRLFDSHFLLELSERNPEAALAYILTLREVSGSRRLERLLARGATPQVLERMFDPRHLLDFCERNPEAALAYLQLLKELGGQQAFKRYMARGMDREPFERPSHPAHLLHLSERNPEAAQAYLQILMELGGGRILQQHFFEREMEPELLERIFNSRQRLEFGSRRLKGLSVWLTCARICEYRRFNEVLLETILAVIAQQPERPGILSSLPIASLADLRWLAERTGSLELRQAIAELVA